jgi:hypothetical protein
MFAVFLFRFTSVEQLFSPETLNSPEISSVFFITPKKNFKISAFLLPVLSLVTKLLTGIVNLLRLKASNIVSYSSVLFDTISLSIP